MGKSLLSVLGLMFHFFDTEHPLFYCRENALALQKLRARLLSVYPVINKR